MQLWKQPVMFVPRRDPQQKLDLYPPALPHFVSPECGSKTDSPCTGPGRMNFSEWHKVRSLLKTRALASHG